MRQRLPQLVVHADWSKDPKKRWAARAGRDADGRYSAREPEPVGDPSVFLRRLRETTAPEASILVGFDFPIGVPRAYARAAGIDDLLAWLPRLGRGKWSAFYDVAERPGEVDVGRPFYPHRPGGTRFAHLLEGLGLASREQLLRQCERRQTWRAAASPLFWTLGAKQVGKAAIAGWRDLLAPELRGSERTVSVWPFDGRLSDLLRPGKLVVAETYPAEVYTHLGIRFPGGSGKRSQTARAANARALLSEARELGVKITRGLRARIEQGFGPRADGEDPFDAVVGLFGMLAVALGRRPPGEPDDEEIRRIEGWILGQARAP